MGIGIYNFDKLLVNSLLQLFKVLNFTVQLITRKAMNSPTWSIKGGEKKNPEAVAISRRIQEIWKPGEGRIGIAYNFIDAQVSFIMTGFISVIVTE